jgi:NADH:ubiquinone oxidoreductase subunit 6 (subunit J)
MPYVLLVIGFLFCAIQALRAARLLVAALWLAGVSAFLATFLYVSGAIEIGVIELSVGTGLVTVLLVFAISLTGEGDADARATVPRPLAWGLAVLLLLMLGWMTVPWLRLGPPTLQDSFASVLWQQRSLDVLVQVMLIFTSALGILHLLSDAHARTELQTVLEHEAPAANDQVLAPSAALDGPREPAAELEEARV